MRVLVFDLPAVSGGALSVLNEVYEEVYNDETCEIQWIFVVSEPKFDGKNNIQIINVPWVKKSWIHRLIFDKFVAKSIVKDQKGELILSLQNLLITGVDIPQILYVHQSIPFSNHKFKFFQDTRLWVYQNLIGKQIFHSIRNAEKVIVQTAWMKKASINKTKVDYRKLEVVSPVVKPRKNSKNVTSDRNKFFYPANGMKYKNHKLVIQALSLVSQERLKEIEIYFTLNGNENKYIKRIYEEVKAMGYPVNFIGNLKKEKVYEYYNSCILIFPSYLETVGLPLLEAKSVNALILAANEPFALEVLEGYSNAEFFESSNYSRLAYLIENSDKINQSLTIQEVKKSKDVSNSIINSTKKYIREMNNEQNSW